MIRFSDVSKVYRTASGEVRALDGISFEIEAGEFVAVRGPSGCGKSTLLSLTGGLALPSAGEVRVDGQLVSSMSSAERAEFRATRIGFVFQMFHLLPYLNVRDNILLAGESAATAGESSPELADQLLERFGLSARRGHRPGQLSAGERQRVAMARALMNRPKLILADEPTGNLDPDSAAAVLDMLDQVHRDGATILLVTHDPNSASRAQRTLRLRAGQIEDSPTETPAS